VAEVSIKRLREYLMSNINTSNLVEVDKVNRYCTLFFSVFKVKVEANKFDVVIIKKVLHKNLKTASRLEKMALISTQLLNID